MMEEYEGIVAAVALALLFLVMGVAIGYDWGWSTCRRLYEPLVSAWKALAKR